MVKDLGADSVFDYNTNDLNKTTQKFDIIFDTVGKMSFKKGKKLLTDKGIFMTPVLSLGVLLTMFFVTPFTRKKLKFSATGMRKHDLQFRDLKIIRDMLQSGNLTSTIDRVYKLEEIQEAHAYVDQGHKRGNVVVRF